MRYELTIETDDVSDIYLMVGLLKLLEKRAGIDQDNPNWRLEAIKELLTYNEDVAAGMDAPSHQVTIRRQQGEGR